MLKNIIPVCYMAAERLRLIISKRNIEIFVLSIIMVFLSDCNYVSADNFDCAEYLTQAAYFADSDDGFDEESEFEEFIDTGGNDDFLKKTKSYYNGFQDFTFTFSHNLSSGTKEPGSEIVTNRSSLRCEFDKTFWNNLFIKFDGKTALYSKNDHIANAGKKDTNYDEEIREFYIQAGFDRFMIKAGKQVVVWGETDGDVINDVVSPRDESEFVFIDLEDSRLGQYMASMDFYSGSGDFFIFVTVKPFVNDFPDRGTRYYRGVDEIVVREDKPDFSDNEAGLKWKKTYNKFEFSVMTATLLQNRGVLEYESGTVYNRVYDRYWFYGIGASYTIGSYLFKIDASFKEEYSLQSKEIDYLYRAKGSNISDAAFGIDYDANGKYMINAELTNRHIFDYSDDLYGMEKDNTGIYFQFSKKFRNDTLAFQYILYHQLQEKNAFYKTELDYSLSDDIQLTLDYTFFKITDQESFLWDYRNEDRIGAEFKYYF